MKAEDILREPERIEHRIMVLINRINYIRSTLMPGGIDYSLDKVQGAASDKYPRAMDIILESEEKVRQLNARRMWLIRDYIPGLISRIQNEMARNVIEIYYTTDATMDDVSDLLHISRATAYRYRWMGEREIDELLKNDTHDTLEL